MLDERSSSLCGIVILIVVVSLFFVPNSAFANGYTLYDQVMPYLLLITIVVFPITMNLLL